MSRRKKTPSEPFYGRSLPSKWRDSYERAQKYPFDAIIEDSFYACHGRIQYLLENNGRISREGRSLLEVAEALANPENEIPAEQRLSEEFLKELQYWLSGLSPDALLRSLSQTLVLADGAQRLSLNHAGNSLRQLEICKALLVNILKHCSDRTARELVVGTIQQLKLEADLPVEDLESLLVAAKEEAKEEIAKEEPIALENASLKGDLWSED
jgi:hypothetical protein